MQSIYSKDSFDRFGDDLCELVLSFTSIEEKFKYECISRQWKRLLFNRQKVLKLYIEFHRSTKAEELLLIEKTLRKCRNIGSIFISNWFSKYGEVFELIVKYCCNLTQIESDFDGLTQKTFKEFFAKFGQNLKEIKFHSNKVLNKEVLKLCPNLSVLDIKLFGKLSVIFNGNEVLFKKLKKISIEYNSDDLNRLKIFIESNKKSLESIELLVENKLKCNAFREIFTELSKLSNLKSLIIECNAIIDESFVTYFQEFSKKCRNLKKIELIINSDNALNLELFKTFNSFKQLKRLNLEFSSNRMNKYLENEWKSESLKELRYLTHLSIDSFCCLSDNFFTNIDKHLPKLQNICCENTNASNQTLQALSKLSDLRTIILVSNSYIQINESLVLELIEKCVKIKLIEFRNRENSVALNHSQISTLRGTDGQNTGIKIVVERYVWQSIWHTSN